MAASSHSKEDLSVDFVHTHFGLTKYRPARPSHARNEPKPRTLTKDREVMLCSAAVPMKMCRPTTTDQTHQERNT